MAVFNVLVMVFIQLLLLLVVLLLLLQRESCATVREREREGDGDQGQVRGGRWFFFLFLFFWFFFSFRAVGVQLVGAGGPSGGTSSVSSLSYTSFPGMCVMDWCVVTLIWWTVFPDRVRIFHLWCQSLRAVRALVCTIFVLLLLFRLLMRGRSFSFFRHLSTIIFFKIFRYCKK